MIYMSKNKIIFSILFSILFLGCGYKQTNTQIRDVSFLKFNKSIFKDYTVIINEKFKFKLDACIQQADTGECRNDTGDKLYEITSGNSVIKVFDNNNKLIMRKEMYLGSSTTMEINLP